MITFAARNITLFLGSCNIPVTRCLILTKSSLTKWILWRKMESNELLPPLYVTEKPLLHILVWNSQPLFLQFPASRQSSWWRCSSFLSFKLLLSLFPLQKIELCMGGHTCNLLSYCLCICACLTKHITAAKVRLHRSFTKKWKSVISHKKGIHCSCKPTGL